MSLFGCSCPDSDFFVCEQNNRLSDDDLISFLRSIKAQSPTLSSRFDTQSKKPAALQIASAEDMAELRALAGLGGFGCVMQPQYYLNVSSRQPVFKTEPRDSNALKTFTIPFASSVASQLQSTFYDTKMAIPAQPVLSPKTPSRSRRATVQVRSHSKSREADP